MPDNDRYKWAETCSAVKQYPLRAEGSPRPERAEGDQSPETDDQTAHHTERLAHVENQEQSSSSESTTGEQRPLRSTRPPPHLAYCD